MMRTQNLNLTSQSFDDMTAMPSTRREGITDRVRQKLNPLGNRPRSTQSNTDLELDLLNLTPQSQEIILRAVDRIRKEDSENVMSVLDQSRDILKDSYEEFKREQEEYRQELEEISKQKESALGRRKENAIPLSIIMRQKRDHQGLADLQINNGMNPTYQAYFEALLTPNSNEQQHSTDKAAVVKYIRRRERRKRAEENQKNNQLTDEILEKQTAELMEKMEDMDIKLEHERQRQNEILRSRMNEKKLKTNNLMQANEILDQANEADLARQRLEQTQREKIEARLLAARHQSSNMIHVQSQIDNHDDEQLNDEQKEITKKSIQLLNNQNNYQTINSITPIYGDKSNNDGVTNIHI